MRFRTPALGVAAVVISALLTSPGAQAGPAATAVRAAGSDSATPATAIERPARGGADLREVTDALSQSVRTAGTAWGVDPATGQVVISVDDTVGRAAFARVRSVAQRFGGATRIERLPGRLRLHAEGGQAVYSGGNRCSLGFNVRSGSTYYFLVVAHCGTVGSTWFADPAHTVLLGTMASTNGNTSIVRYTNAGVAKPGSIHLYPGSQDIVSAGNAFVGQRVCRSGLTTGVRCGTVTALNQTVNFPEGTLTGLVRTNVCSEPGDSGGPFFSGTTALGLTVGGSGNCSSGGVTYFQPVVPALNASASTSTDRTALRPR
ncbi:MAG: peptidase alpha-lytic pro domain protein [Streptosporangiaceae bacterium]|nr:peptidase alpha-lytic pro domain protein [Streptosporangiaceae bacterium]